MEYSFRRVVRVFISSPSDIQEEKRIVEEIFAELNRHTARDRNIYLEATRWENTGPAAGDTQLKIFDQIGEYDIYLGMMWTKFGSPTKRAKSGTVEEYHHALGKLRDERLDDIFLWFRTDYPPTVVGKELTKIQAWKSEVGKFVKYQDYKGTDDFKSKVRAHFDHWIARQPHFVSHPFGANYIMRNGTGSASDCLFDYHGRLVPSSVESVESTSDLYYLLIERVQSCAQARNAIKAALNQDQISKSRFSATEFRVTGLYDTMGKWDVLVRFRAAGLLDTHGLLNYLAPSIQFLGSDAEDSMKIVRVEHEAPDIQTLVQDRNWSGDISHKWPGSTQAYRDKRLQRFFIYIELPAAQKDRNTLLQHLAVLIKNNDLARSIESVSIAAQTNALVLEILTTCAEAQVIHELNRYIDNVISVTGKYTLCCYECDEGKPVQAN